MKRILFTIITTMLIASCNKQKDAIISPQENKSQRIVQPEVGIIPYSEMWYNQCAGDSVLVTGNLPYKLTETFITNNRYLIDYFVDLNSMRGIGQTTGLTYIGKGYIKDHVIGSLDSLNHSVEGKQTYRLILDAGQTAIIVDEDFHYIADAKGNVLLDTQSIADTCR